MVNSSQGVRSSEEAAGVRTPANLSLVWLTQVVAEDVPFHHIHPAYAIQQTKSDNLPTVMQTRSTKGALVMAQSGLRRAWSTGMTTQTPRQPLMER